MENILSWITVFFETITGFDGLLTFSETFSAISEFITDALPLSPLNTHFLGGVEAFALYLVGDFPVLLSLVVWVFLSVVCLSLALFVPYKVIKRFCRGLKRVKY